MGSVVLKRTRANKGILFLFWFLACLVFSVIVHLLFLFRAEKWVISGFSAESYDMIIPRTFKMKRVEIDPKNLEEPKKEKETEQPVKHVELAKEMPLSAQPEQVAPNKTVLSKPEEIHPSEKPVAGTKNLDLETLLQKNAGKSATAPFMELSKNSDQSLKLPEPDELKESGRDGIAGKKFSSLDELLSGSVALNQGTAPILMPTDLLFEYDSADLRADAARSLEKLGTLIRNNTQALFRIEGHTDSFGGEDYNKALSLRRAEAVKTWLQQNMGIEAGRISTAGFGKSRLLVPASGTVEQQQLNRRVEIVISTR